MNHRPVDSDPRGSVRLAGPADDEHLVRLRRSWTEEQTGGEVEDDGFDRRFAEWLAVERHQRLTWLGWQFGPTAYDGEPVGMLNVLVFTRMPKPGRPDSRWGYLANFYVAREHRGAGLGRLMLETCLAHCDAAGFVRVVLSPSERSVPFYERGGFGPASSLLLRERQAPE